MTEIKLFSAVYEECKKDVISFRNANRDIRRDEAYFDWRYLQRPCRLKPVIVWAESPEGSKIGSLTLIPHDFYVYDRVLPLGVLGDISVAKEWRGKGIAVRMLEYLSSVDEVNKLAACVVLPNKEASRPLARTGWIEATRLVRYVKILDVSPAVKEYTGDNTFSMIISKPANMILKLLSSESFVKNRAEYKGEVVKGFDERFDDLWNKAEKDGMVIGLRNREYLSWRYHAHPLVTYKIFTLLNHSSLSGYIVFHDDGNSCYIDDIFGLNEGNDLKYLMSSFLKEMRCGNFLFSVTARINKNHPSYNFLGKLGFIERPDYQAFMVKTAKTSDDRNPLPESNKWYLTPGDKDV